MTASSRQSIGVVLFLGGAITFIAYPQIVRMGAKKHPEKDFTKMTATDKIVMGLSVASFFTGGVMWIGEDIGILKTQS
jgi:hypothetical protein